MYFGNIFWEAYSVKLLYYVVREKIPSIVDKNKYADGANIMVEK